jgi:hypothetical protein
VSKRDRVRDVIEKADRDDNVAAITFTDDKALAMIKRVEAEKEKPEAQKKHEKWRRQQKRMSTPTAMKIVPSKKMVSKPGTFFEGPLKVLVAKYKNMDELFQHMTLGQLNKYYEKEGDVYRIYRDGKPDKLVYNGKTEETFDE